MSEQQNVRLVQEIYQAFGRGDVPAILATMSPRVDWNFHGPEIIPFAGRYRNPDGVAEFLGRVGAAAEVERYEPREFVPGADGVVTVLGWQRVRARATGRAWETHWAHIWTLEGGRVVRVHEFYDTAALARAFEGETP